MRSSSHILATALLSGVTALSVSNPALSQTQTLQEIPEVCFIEPEHRFVLNDENRETCAPFEDTEEAQRSLEQATVDPNAPAAPDQTGSLPEPTPEPTDAARGNNGRGNTEVGDPPGGGNTPNDSEGQRGTDSTGNGSGGGNGAGGNGGG